MKKIRDEVIKILKDTGSDALVSGKDELEVSFSTPGALQSFHYTCYVKSNEVLIFVEQGKQQVVKTSVRGFIEFLTTACTNQKVTVY